MSKRKHNSEGIKMMFGGAGSWNEPALPPKNTCAFRCEQQLLLVGKTALCLGCGALYIRRDTGLLDYLGKSNERDRCEITSEVR